MKRFSLILTLVMCITTVSFAQKGKVARAKSFLTAGKLDEAKKTIDEAIVHESCVAYPEAFFTKGQIYQSIVETQVDAYKKLDSQALSKAWDAYQEVIKLDTKKKYTKKLNAAYKNLLIDFTNQGITYYNAEQFKEAVGAFETVLAINNSPIMTIDNTPARVDTAVIYNLGIAAQRAQMLPQAEKYLRMALQYNYEPARCYGMLSNILKQAGKEEEAVKMLHEGFEKYPDNSYMLVELINYYLLGSSPEKAEKYLDAAIAQDPKNATFYRAKGNLYDKINRPDDAEKMYLKTLELSPNDFIAYYSLGNIKLNRVNELLTEVQAIEDIKKYEAGMEKVFEEFAKVIPYFEKARELDSKDKNTVTILKELYFRLRDKNPEYKQKYEEVVAILETM